MTPDPGQSDRGRTDDVATYAGLVLALMAAVAAAVLVWSNRFRGWVLVPVAAVAVLGIALALVGRRRR
jgi:hypothetical protein